MFRRNKAKKASSQARVSRDEAAMFCEAFRQQCAQMQCQPPPKLIKELEAQVAMKDDIERFEGLELKKLGLTDVHVRALMSTLAMYPIVRKIDLRNNLLSTTGVEEMLNLMKFQQESIGTMESNAARFPIGSMRVLEKFKIDGNRAPESDPIVQEFNEYSNVMQVCNAKLKIIRAFKDVDTENTGLISAAQIEAAYEAIVGKAPKDRIIDGLIRSFSSNRSQLTFNEFDVAMITELSSLREIPGLTQSQKDVMRAPAPEPLSILSRGIDEIRAPSTDDNNSISTFDSLNSATTPMRAPSGFETQPTIPEDEPVIPQQDNEIDNSLYDIDTLSSVTHDPSSVFETPNTHDGDNEGNDHRREDVNHLDAVMEDVSLSELTPMRDDFDQNSINPPKEATPPPTDTPSQPANTITPIVKPLSFEAMKLRLSQEEGSQSSPVKSNSPMQLTVSTSQFDRPLEFDHDRTEANGEGRGLSSWSFLADDLLISSPDITTSLTVLLLPHNQLTSFDGRTLSRLVSLTKLNLSNNLITSVEPWWDENEQVSRRTIVSENSIFRNLTCLDLSNNSISRINGLERFYGLKVLSLAHNGLKSTSGLETLQALEQLDISYNQIPNLLAIRGLTLNKNIRNLHLRGNRVADIPRYRPSVISMFPHMIALDQKAIPPIHNAGNLSPRLTAPAKTTKAPLKPGERKIQENADRDRMESYQALLNKHKKAREEREKSLEAMSPSVRISSEQALQVTERLLKYAKKAPPTQPPPPASETLSAKSPRAGKSPRPPASATSPRANRPRISDPTPPNSNVINDRLSALQSDHTTNGSSQPVHVNPPASSFADEELKVYVMSRPINVNALLSQSSSRRATLLNRLHGFLVDSENQVNTLGTAIQTFMTLYIPVREAIPQARVIALQTTVRELGLCEPLSVPDWVQKVLIGKADVSEDVVKMVQSSIRRVAATKTILNRIMGYFPLEGPWEGIQWDSIASYADQVQRIREFSCLSLTPPPPPSTPVPPGGSPVTHRPAAVASPVPLELNGDAPAPAAFTTNTTKPVKTVPKLQLDVTEFAIPTPEKEQNPQPTAATIQETKPTVAIKNAEAAPVVQSPEPAKANPTPATKANTTPAPKAAAAVEEAKPKSVPEPAKPAVESKSTAQPTTVAPTTTAATQENKKATTTTTQAGSTAKTVESSDSDMSPVQNLKNNRSEAFKTRLQQLEDSDEEPDQKPTLTKTASLPVNLQQKKVTLDSDDEESTPASKPTSTTSTNAAYKRPIQLDDSDEDDVPVRRPVLNKSQSVNAAPTTTTKPISLTLSDSDDDTPIKKPTVTTPVNRKPNLVDSDEDSPIAPVDKKALAQLGFDSDDSPVKTATTATSQSSKQPAATSAPVPPVQEEEEEIEWVEGYDETYNQFYYFNEATGESIWEKPARYIPYDPDAEEEDA